MKMLELLISTGLVVLIWIIQCLHYPSFLFIDKKKFASFENFHTRRITYIVMPLMIGEVILLFFNPDMFVVLLTTLVWLSTFFLQIPCHHKLKFGFDEAVIQRLICTNWIRTILWSLKLIYLIALQKW